MDGPSHAADPERPSGPHHPSHVTIQSPSSQQRSSEVPLACSSERGQLRWLARVPWLAGVVGSAMGHPSVSRPHACCPLIQKGPVEAKEDSAPSFPGRTAVEPVALWLKVMIKDGKLVWMSRGCGEGGPPGALVPVQESLDQGGAGPASPAQLFCQMNWEGRISGGRGHFPGGRGKPCCSGGCGPSCHA